LTNASVEFDSETLAPTYRLQIGLPGKSNALAIAGRLGLEPDLLADASSMVDSGQIQVENLLAGIQLERQRADVLRDEAEVERREVARVRRELEERLRNIEQERRDVLRRARREAEIELAELRAKLRQAAAAVQRSDSTRAELLSTAHTLENAARKTLAKPGTGTAVAGLPTLRASSAPPSFAVGDRVRLHALNQEARIAGIEGDTLEVMLGNFKTRVNRDEVEWIGRGRETVAGPATTGASVWKVGVRESPGMQLDLRGWRAEQVIPELERYLNDAYLSGLRTVRIVHGKGTGVLRQVVREYLEGTSLVENFETADVREGGDGATVAYLAV
jgi:DNA mismatch repair protein MutS2